ncbi:MAG: hypothetical protein LiPW16_87 [Microgenomates group bacterium LiPW_16]|nr:MAG: hypothetical protein LiPW16_87 [Microgenomates group bacterium LiPW_16]
MEPKEIEKKPIAPQDLEGLFAKKEVTLPHSVSKYISRLKAEGRLDEAKL